MKRLLIILFSLFVFCSIGYCQEEPLQLIIKAGLDVYDSGQEMEIEATFKNNSDKDIILFWSTGIPHVVKSASGEVGSVTIQTSNLLEPEVKKIYIYSKDSVTKLIKIPTLNWETLAYQITLKYSSLELGSKLKPLSYQKIFTDSLSSNTITVKVVNNQKFKY